MKNILFLLMIPVLITSCKTASYSQYLYHTSLIEPIKDNRNMYKDDKLEIEFHSVTDQIAFRLDNKSDKAIKINWDELSLVQYGNAGRVIHKGTKLVDKDKAQVPTIIPKGSYWEDEIIPVNNIYYQEPPAGTLYSRAKGWVIIPLFVQQSMSKEEDLAKVLIGETITLHFPIYFNNEKTDYNFKFRINDLEFIRSTKKEMRINENAEIKAIKRASK